MAQLQAVEIPAPHGMLEGLLRLPDANAPVPRMIALICHPHPLGGGTMHNKVVFRVAQALGKLGIPSLRFNFRGVGRSTGSYDAGRGEQDDVCAALDYLVSRFSESPDISVCLAGFSFGSAVGLPVGCADPRVRQLIGVGVPVSLMGVNTLDSCAKHKLIVQGEHDEYGPLAEVRAWFAHIPEPKHLTIVPGADHFFTDYQMELHDAVIDYFQSGASVLGIL
jgi:alpha/beta superfamily hydrolase